MKNRATLALAALAAGCLACGDGGGGAIDEPVDAGAAVDGGLRGGPGPWTGTLCPVEGTELTYQNFGRPFLESYCFRCHGLHVTGEARQGAPVDHMFDTALDCWIDANHIDQRTGSGPLATNEQMPPDGPFPTVEERRKLSLWLSCGAR